MSKSVLLVLFLAATLCPAWAEVLDWPPDPVPVYIRGRVIPTVWRDGVPWAERAAAGHYFGLPADQAGHFNLAEAVAAHANCQVKRRPDGSLEVVIHSAATQATAATAAGPAGSSAGPSVGDLGRSYGELKARYELINTNPKQGRFKKPFPGGNYLEVVVDWDGRNQSRRVEYTYVAPAPYFGMDDIEEYKQMYGGGFREIGTESWARDFYYFSESKGVVLIARNSGGDRANPGIMELEVVPIDVLREAFAGPYTPSEYNGISYEEQNKLGLNK